MIRVDKAEYIWRDGYPLLILTIGARVATLSPDQKPGLLVCGVVSLGAGFEDLPSMVVHPDGPDEPSVEVDCCTADPVVCELYRRFATSRRIVAGPVDVPQSA